MQENPFSDNILTFKICANWCLLSPIPNLVINGRNPCYHEAEKGTLLQVYCCKSHGVLADLTWQNTKLIIFLLDSFLVEKICYRIFLYSILLLCIIFLLFINICYISVLVKASIFFMWRAIQKWWLLQNLEGHKYH